MPESEDDEPVFRGILSEETVETVGEEVTVSFDIETIEDEEQEVAGYEVTIEYDSSVVEFLDASGEDMDDPEVTPSQGAVTLFVASFPPLEETPLTAATLTFQGESIGISPLTFGDDAEILPSSPGVNEPPPETQDGSITVGSPPKFEITAFQVPESVGIGEEIGVEVTIENTGDSSGSQELIFEVDNEVDTTETLSLSGGASTTETFSYTTSEDDVPDVTVGVRTDDDSIEAVVPVVVGGISLEHQWTVAADARPQHANPAIADGTVVFAGLGESVFALDTEDGEALWEDGNGTRDGALSDSGPTIVDGIVYVGSGVGLLYAFALSNGALLWTYDTAQSDSSTGSAITSTPAVADGTVYVGTNDGTVHAVSAGESGGEGVWTRDIGASVLTEPAVSDGTVLLTARDGRVVAIDGADGDDRWEFETEHSFEASAPTVSDGTAYVAADELYALDIAADAAEREQWSVEFGGTAGSSPLVSDGTVSVGSADGSVTAFDADDGEKRWRIGLSGNAAIMTDPALVSGGESGYLIVVTADGTVAAIEQPEGDGQVGATFDISDLLDNTPLVQSSLASAEEGIYIGTRDAYLSILLLIE